MNLRDIVNGSTVLIDTNVLLYARNRRSPLCRELLLRCEQGAVNGVITLTTLAEFSHRCMIQEAQGNGLVGSNRADQGSSSSVVRVSVNGECNVDEGGFDAERLETGQLAPTTAPLKLPVDAEARTDEAIRLWTASRRTEMPEGTIVRCDLLGVSAAV